MTDIYIVVTEDPTDSINLVMNVDVQIFTDYSEAQKYCTEHDGLIKKKFLPGLFTAEDMANDRNEYRPGG